MAHLPGMPQFSRKSLLGAAAASLTAGAVGIASAPAASGMDLARRRRLRRARARLVVHHAHTENVHRFARTLDTFDHARYEVIPTGQTPDGRSDVRDYYTEGRTTFPDQRNTEMVLRHADDAVIAEFFLEGTMKGSLRGLPPTGKSFRVRTIAIFVFEHNTTNLINERAYLDAYSVLQQIGLLEVAAAAQVRLPDKEIPIDRREPGVFPVET